MPAATGPRLSIIVPAFDEAARLPVSLPKIIEFCSRLPFSYEVLIVVEKSADGTLDLARELVTLHPHFRVIDNEVHRGKGYAVRSGMLQAGGEFVFYMDVDLSVPLEHVLHFVNYFEGHPDAGVLIGNRQHPRSRIIRKQSLLRETMGRIFNWLIQFLAGLRVRDTQCGFKAFRARAAREIFMRQRIDGFAFDVEALLLAHSLGWRIVDLPVEWINSPDSKVDIVRDSFRMLRDAVEVRRLADRKPGSLLRALIWLRDAVQAIRAEGAAGVLGVVIMLVGFAAMVLRGLVGYGRPAAQWRDDFHKIYQAGSLWLADGNPYTAPAICYAYPPHASSVTAIMSLCSSSCAQVVNSLISIGSLFGIFAIYVAWFRDTVARDKNAMWWPALIGFGYLMASNFTTSSLFFGGFAIPVYFSITLAWYLLFEKNRPWLAGVFLAFGTLKPQFSLFFCLYLLVDRRWRTLFGAGIAVLVLSIPAFIRLGPVGAFEGWWHSVHAYGNSVENMVGSGGIITFDSVLASLGVSRFSLKFVAVVGFLLSFGYRRRFEPKHFLVILPFLSLAFIFSHDADYISLSLMWLCLFEVAARDLRRLALLVVSALLLFIPSAMMESARGAILPHWRVFVVTGVFAAYMFLVPLFKNAVALNPAIP